MLKYKCFNRSNVAKHVNELGKSRRSLVAPGDTLMEEWHITITIITIMEG